jgi:hypothetical protein
MQIRSFGQKFALPASGQNVDGHANGLLQSMVRLHSQVSAQVGPAGSDQQLSPAGQLRMDCEQAVAASAMTTHSSLSTCGIGRQRFGPRSV